MSGQYPSYPGEQPDGQGGSTPPPQPDGQGGQTPPPPPYGSPAPDQPPPGQPPPGQPYPGQPYPGQPYPGQPYPGQPYPAQPPGGQPYGPAPGHPGYDPYAHWGLRLAAYLLDGLISTATFIPLYIVGYGFLIADSDMTGAPAGGPLTLVGVLFCFASVLVMIGFMFWNYGIRQGSTGQTLGKQIVSIKVVKEDGTPLGTWLSVGRTLLFSLLTSCTCYINALWPLWDAKKQALHDKVVSTVVLKA